MDKVFLNEKMGVYTMANGKIIIVKVWVTSLNMMKMVKKQVFMLDILKMINEKMKDLSIFNIMKKNKEINVVNLLWLIACILGQIK